MVVPTCVSVQNGQCLVRIVNLGDEHVWLQPKTRLGIAPVVDVVHEPEQSERCRVEVSEHEIVVHIEKVQVDITVESVHTSLDDLPFKVDLGDMTFSDEQTSDITKLFHEYKDCFCQDGDDLGYTEAIRHKIPTVDEIPIRVPHRRIPPHQMAEVRDHIEKMVKPDIIIPSKSPYAAPVELSKMRTRYQGYMKRWMRCMGRSISVQLIWLRGINRLQWIRMMVQNGVLGWNLRSFRVYPDADGSV
jgi:hypothetical protein